MVGVNIFYSSKSSNTTLRNHLESNHKAEYLRMCEANQWVNMLPKMKKELELKREADNLAGGGGGSGGPRPTFSQSQFLKSLVNFIVADDQVSNKQL
jgi:hypothetical protein